ncbi:MAG: hypothetical protein JSS49_11650 [Planctomycetes bacterium]|nr:hypothetical protein [Planctomycetota bacterium]
MRYLVAIVVSIALIAALSFSIDQMGRTLHQHIRQGLLAAKERGELPADFDLESEMFTDFGMELSESDMFRAGIVDFWMAYRAFLIPLIVILSLSIARCFPATGKVSKTSASAPIPVESQDESSP